jgi:hypothetical protein
MAQLLRRDIEKQVLDALVFNAEALGRILHRRLKLPVRPAQLLLHHIGVIRVGPVYPHILEQLLFMSEHNFPPVLIK